MPMLHFIKANPSGNTTVYILDAVPSCARAQIAAKIMKEPYVCAEQVGFITPPSSPLSHGRLHMMGGEFCANAARGFAAWLCMGHMENGAPALRRLDAPKKEIVLYSSGCEEPVTALAEDIGCDNGCRVTLGMPAPLFVQDCVTNELGACTLVGFSGITHAVLWGCPPSAAHMDAVISLVRANDLYDGCVGALFMDKAALRMTPLVYVADTDTLVWESSCGSGTAAVACAMAMKAAKDVAGLMLIQPGGSLGADAVYAQGRIAALHLSGDVYFTASGTLYIEY